MKRCLVVFAKEPRKGRVKTRLAKHLTQDECLDLYKAFLKDTLNLARNINSDYKIVAYDSPLKRPHYLKSIAYDFVFHKQDGRDLGERMHNAFKFAESHNASKVVLIGSDSPNLPISFVKSAFKKMNEFDVVLGPSFDGGYYLIGLKKPERDIFRNIRWSSRNVLSKTIKNSKKLRLTLTLLDQWYDIDNRKSLNFLRSYLNNNKDKNTATYTKRFLKKLDSRKFLSPKRLRHDFSLLH